MEYSLEGITLYSQPSPPLTDGHNWPRILSTECAHHYCSSQTILRRWCPHRLPVQLPSRPPVSWRVSCVRPTGSSCSTTPLKSALVTFRTSSIRERQLPPRSAISRLHRPLPLRRRSAVLDAWETSCPSSLDHVPPEGIIRKDSRGKQGKSMM